MSGTLKRRDPRFAGRVAEKWLEDEGFDTLPIRPRLIAARLDIMVQAKPDTSPGVSGMLLRHGDNFAIVYATHVPSAGFQNFSIAHEIGHYLLEGHFEHLFASGETVHSSRAGFVSADPFEQEADHFAAGLLMPIQLFAGAMRRCSDGLEGIEQLAALCETSLTATAIRYAQRATVPAAVVMSTDGLVDYCFMSKAMQEFEGLRWLRKGDALPEGAATERFVRDRQNVTQARRDQAATDLRRWFGGARAVAATEEVLGLGAYGKVLTVLTAKNFADEDGDDDAEERWTPRFRR